MTLVSDRQEMVSIDLKYANYDSSFEFFPFIAHFIFVALIHGHRTVHTLKEFYSRT